MDVKYAQPEAARDRAADPNIVGLEEQGIKAYRLPLFITPSLYQDLRAPLFRHKHNVAALFTAHFYNL